MRLPAPSVYDPWGQLVQTKSAVRGASDGDQQVVVECTTFDALGRPVSQALKRYATDVYSICGSRAEFCGCQIRAI